MKLHQCPCCGSHFLARKSKACPACDQPLYMNGDYFPPPAYLYTESRGWEWFQEDRTVKHWKEGPKRLPKPDAKNRTPHWLETYGSVDILR